MEALARREPISAKGDLTDPNPWSRDRCLMGVE